MATKEERQATAEKHEGLMKVLFSGETKAAIESVKIYEDGEGRELEIPEARFESTQTKVMTRDIVSVVSAVAQGGKKTVVLDPASFTTPGGGYLRGNFGQEEQLCHESNLYAVLEAMKDVYYTPNRQAFRGGLYTDKAMYITDIVVMRDKKMSNVDVIVSAPVNRRDALQNHRDEVECDNDLKRRVESVLRIAAFNGADTLVMGAFGCDWMGNSPAVVAQLISEWLEAHPGVFETLVFAVQGGANIDAFKAQFPEVDQQKPEQVEEGPEDEDDDLDELEQSESGSWVFD